MLPWSNLVKFCSNNKCRALQCNVPQNDNVMGFNADNMF